MTLEEGAASVLRTSAGLKAGEDVLIIADPERLPVGRAFFYAAAAAGCDPVFALIGTRDGPAGEAPELLAAAMLEADVLLLATTHSMTHTHARRAANRAGARVVSMPAVTEAMLEGGGALTADHTEIQQKMRRLQRQLRGTTAVHVATPAGTDATFMTRGRDWNFKDTGVAVRKGEVTTLPAGEIFVAPVEGTAEGRLAPDMYFHEPLHEPASVLLKEGYATRVTGAESAILEMNRGGREGRNVAKLGIGLNPRAKATSSLPEAEKSLGAVHIVFGDSIPFGGRISCGVRVDAILADATVEVDGKPLIERGKLAA